MGYRIEYYQIVLDHDIPRLPSDMIVRIEKAIEERLATHPDSYGAPLRKWLAGFWKLRVGDWRIIYEIEGDTVSILMIAHRSRVYDLVIRRLPV